jgi:hypothetical protein
VIVIELSCNFQSSYHCILLNLSLLINSVILSLVLLTAGVEPTNFVGEPYSGEQSTLFQIKYYFDWFGFREFFKFWIEKVFLQIRDTYFFLL